MDKLLVNLSKCSSKERNTSFKQRHFYYWKPQIPGALPIAWGMLRFWPTTDLRPKTKCTSRALRRGHYKDLTETPKSHFCCSFVWQFCGARDADKLKALNKRILRFILGNYSSPYTTFLSKVNSTSLWNKRVQNFLIFPLIWRIRFHSGPLPMIFAATTFFNLVNLKQLHYLYADSFCLYIIVL